jgi:hypothetical protein
VNVQRFLTQTAVLERRTTQDAYSGHAYAAAVTIPARWATATRLLQGKDGGEVVSDTHVSVTALITEGDRITDESGRARTVVRVRANRGTRGTFSHYVAYLA